MAVLLAALCPALGRWGFVGAIGPPAAACLGYSAWVVFNFDWVPATAAFWLLAGTAWSGVRAAETEAGVDAPTACRAIDLLAQMYGLAPGEMTVAALSTASRIALTPQHQEALTRSALTAADQALPRDDYDLAARLATLAASPAAVPLVLAACGWRLLGHIALASIAAISTMSASP